MTGPTAGWTREAVLERLAASDAIDLARRVELRERASRRLDLLDVVSGVEGGRIDAEQAASEFRRIRLVVERAAAVTEATGLR